jgi:hypothetical protein
MLSPGFTTKLPPDVEPIENGAQRVRPSAVDDLAWKTALAVLEVKRTSRSRAAKEGTKAYSLIFQMVAGPPFSCRFAAEHSSVMRIGLVSSYISR